MLEIAERVHTALEAGARQLHKGLHVSCSLALLPVEALKGMPHHWGTAELIPQQELSVALVVGVGVDVVTEAITGFLSRQRQRNRPEEGGNKGDVLPPIISPLVGSLAPAVVELMLLLLPAHDSLWNRRRRWLKERLASSLNADRNQHRHIELLLLLQELLFTSLLLSCHYKKQEVWVHRWWVVSQLLSYAELNTEVFHCHDRGALLEAADKHPMNYNAWNYRRRAVASLVRGEKQNAIDVLLLHQEMGAAVRFFETHNNDTSAASYLIFLLEQAAEGGSSVNCPLAHRMWSMLMGVTARELRRHCDKGHESVWMLRLALMWWGLHNRPLCGWTLQDELDFASAFVAVPLMDEKEEGKEEKKEKVLGRQAITWVDVSGSYRWTSYHAARYGLQLLRMVQTI